MEIREYKLSFILANQGVVKSSCLDENGDRRTNHPSILIIIIIKVRPPLISMKEK
jgi:hypothetical protein